MEDIAPKLLEQIQNDFRANYKKSKKIIALKKKLADGLSNYKDGHSFAIEVGNLLADAFANNLYSNALPDGRLYYNIADRIIRPMMKEDFDLIAEHSAEIQSILNKRAGIGIKAIRPEMNEDKVQGIIDIVSGKERFDDIAYMLDEPIVNFSQCIVDDTVKANADFQYKAGLSPKIIRTTSGKCCKWCEKLAGVYDYEKVSDTGNDVFKRHRACKCLVEYDAGDGKRQNVHTKRWTNGTSGDTIKAKKTKETPKNKEKRIKEENGLDLISRIAGHPKMLGAYTPEGLYHTLQKQGYKTKPLKGKNYRDIPFEEGGGYRVNFGGDGILMYHPGERSHHGGEYYKISTGKGGVKRYDINGEEKED